MGDQGELSLDDVFTGFGGFGVLEVALAVVFDFAFNRVFHFAVRALDREFHSGDGFLRHDAFTFAQGDVNLCGVPLVDGVELVTYAESH